MGAMTPRIGGQGCGTLDGLDALVNDVGVAHLMGVEEAREGRAARELNGFEGRPLGEEVAEDGGVFVVEPLEDMREVVFQGTGEAIRETYFVADQTTAMFDEWFEGTYGGALGVEGVEVVAMREQELKLEFGVSRVVLGMAGCEGLPVPREGEGVDGKEYEEVILTQRGDDGTLVSSRPMAMGCPLNRVRKVLTHASMVCGWCSRTLNSRVWEPAACRQTSCVASAQSMPTKAANSSVGRRVMGHLL